MLATDSPRCRVSAGDPCARGWLAAMALLAGCASHERRETDPWPMNATIQLAPRLELRPVAVPVRVEPEHEENPSERVATFSCPWATFLGDSCGVERSDAPDGSTEFDLWGSSGHDAFHLVLRFHRGPEGS